MRRHGFTLLEVLVGIAILALAAVVLGAAYVNTLGAHAAVAQRAAAGGAGLEYLHEAVLAEPDREFVERGGRLALPDGRTLDWEGTVEEAKVPDLFRVVVRGRITGGAEGGEETFEQRLMLLRPMWSDPARREQLRADWNRAREEAARR